MIGNISFDEHQIMSLYDTGTREGLIKALEEMRGNLTDEDTDISKITDSCIEKLGVMTDEEYAELELFPEFPDDIEETEDQYAD